MASLELSEVRHEPLVARGISHYSCPEKFRSLLIAPRVRNVDSTVNIHEIDVRLINVFGVGNIILLLKRNSCSYHQWPKVARAATYKASRWTYHRCGEVCVVIVTGPAWRLALVCSNHARLFEIKDSLCSLFPCAQIFRTNHLCCVPALSTQCGRNRQYLIATEVIFADPQLCNGQQPRHRTGAYRLGMQIENVIIVVSFYVANSRARAFVSCSTRGQSKTREKFIAVLAARCCWYNIVRTMLWLERWPYMRVRVKESPTCGQIITTVV